MKKDRKIQLSKNAPRLFWIKALLNMKALNIVMSLFYLHRGLELPEIFYLSMFWAAGGFIFEIPSSYLADRWGRKKTLLLGAAVMSVYFFVLVFAHGFAILAFATFLYGAGFACLSGTDEALLYDTECELKREKYTLGKLGKFRSAKSFLKIATSIIGALIAKDLSSAQFIIITVIDCAAAVIALVLTVRLVEPKHHMDLEEQEAGVMKDAISLLVSDRPLMRAILNKELLFFAFFMTWAYYQKFFTDLGLSILTIGILWGINHGVQFLWFWHIGRLHEKKYLTHRINELAALFTVATALFLIMLYVGAPAISLFIMYLLIASFEAFREPLFSELFNKRFKSYNRATTISLSNLVHNFLEYPLMLGAAVLIVYDIRFPFFFTFVLGIIVVLFLQVGKTKIGAQRG